MPATKNSRNRKAGKTAPKAKTKTDTAHIKRAAQDEPVPNLVDYYKLVLELVRDLADTPLADPDVDGPDAWRDAYDRLETLKDEASTLIGEIDAASVQTAGS